MTIGEVAKRAGMRTSAIRYYESIGLLPPASRSGGQRRYGGAAILRRLRFIQNARSAGLSLAAIRQLFAPGPVSEHWRAVAEQKLAELDEVRERLARLSQCTCATVEECEGKMARGLTTLS